ncbi:MAG: phasin family protein, partial [Bacteroidota bacterium]
LFPPSPRPLPRNAAPLGEDRSLANHCYDLRFTRPLKVTIAKRVKAIREQLDDASDKASDAVTSRVKDAKYMAEETADKMEDRVQEAVAVVMKRLGVPTREEISELTASVERLTKHIDSLKSESAATTSDELVLEAVGGGWYEIRVGEVVVEKVQGKETADKAFARVQEQHA